ncbi:MAG: pantoate--beta-alanine ligase [Muribaculum sp.]|nr:pantoate--beta-alanine ligase [Muribaculaceae bacterium]MCM1081364.1 pantoate--beta-alanine ligase [Muribaculum sp.]
MQIIRTVSELQNAVETAKLNQKKVGLVPTMGALHQGHLSLVKAAREANDFVVVSVFVNPTQFNNANDLKTYPRTEEADCRLLEDAGVDVAFVPTVDEVYPEPDTRQFDLGAVAEVMEGAMRPGHFNGVAQVVSRLFDIVKPHRAYFGEKDFQQIAVIRRMVELEKFNLEIVPCPIVRADDGLALSSRNVRLSKHQREIAPNIHRILNESLEWAKKHSISETQSMVIDAINRYPEMEVEYYSIVDRKTMQPVNHWPTDGEGTVGCVTVYLGDVRLIDNIKYPVLK